MMRFRTIGLISILALRLLAGPLPGEAQKAGKVYRIGYLGPISFSSATGSVRRKEFREGLRELGYVERQNVVFEDTCLSPMRRSFCCSGLMRCSIEFLQR
jgi:hypothetical protein